MCFNHIFLNQHVSAVIADILRVKLLHEYKGTNVASCVVTT